jgi:SAM-dependent methyltransferase
MDELTQDIFEWDILNWSKALDFWTKEIDIKDKNFKCLELGGRRGGLSLWLAMNNNSVICSDLESPEEIATKLHTKYNCTDKIEYQSICATDIPYENEFDIVVFKSIMGGISGNGQDHLKKQMIDQIYKSLKPNGKLLFAENLESSFIHKGFRKTFIKWGERWNYLKHDEIKHVFSSFDNVKFKTVGFFGTFGRSESQRNFLSKLDNVVTKVVPKSKRYILFGVTEKNNV